jgi:hypothetical protein
MFEKLVWTKHIMNKITGPNAKPTYQWMKWTFLHTTVNLRSSAQPISDLIITWLEFLCFILDLRFHFLTFASIKSIDSSQIQANPSTLLQTLLWFSADNRTWKIKFLLFQLILLFEWPEVRVPPMWTIGCPWRKCPTQCQCYFEVLKIRKRDN